MTTKLFIDRPILSISISILFVMIGIIGLTNLPMEQYPDIAPPTVMVSATYTGASAETLQKSVIVPLEESINGVENMSASSVRLRPILMTALCMIIGMLPLVFATGAGANGNTSLGVGVVGGMLVGTITLLVIEPVLFIVFQSIEERVMPKRNHEIELNEC